MRIAVLAYNLHVGGGLSVGQNIVALLPKVGPEHTYLILVPKGKGYAKHEEKENIEVKEIPRMNFIRRLLFDVFCLPRLVKEFHPDVVWGLGNIGLRKPSCKQAILFHQPHLIYEARYYGKMTFLERIKITGLIKWWLRRSLKHTNLVFCQTPVARDRFSRSFHYPVDKIKIMPNAVSRFAAVSRQLAGVPKILEKDTQFNLFFLTKFYAHKNLEILIDIFRKYSETLKGIRCIVTVAPEQHCNAKKFLSNIRRYNLQESIVNVGPLKQEELAGYFYNSQALFFPTLLESFSGTYLEAMHFGLPILTSDLDFARHVCGDAALYFNPWDPQDIIDKINTMKKDGFLREGLINNGRQRASSFFRNWEDIVASAIKEIEFLGKG